MKTLRSFGAIFFACCLTFQHLSVAQQASAPSATCQVYFSPRGGANSGIVQTLDKARSSVLVQAYSFTSTTLAEALVRVHKKGINVQVILDKSQKAYKYSTADFLAGAGIPVFIDAVHAIAHNKVMVIDSEIVITGSFNFTKAAEERNAENLLIVRSKELAARYVDNWRIHQRHSTPFR